MKLTNHPSRALLLAAAVTQAGVWNCGAAEHTYQHFRFVPLVVRGSVANPAFNDLQLSEFLFFDGSSNPVDTSGVTVLVTAPETFAGEDGPASVDGDNLTKWFEGSFNNSDITFTFPAPTTIGEFNYVTANDFADRDPVSWILEGSNDEVTWTVIDYVDGFEPATDRNVVAGANRILPATAAAPPIIDLFEINDLDYPTIMGKTAIVPNGMLEFGTQARYADTLTIQAAGAAAVSPPNDGQTNYTDVPLPDDRDSVVTFTATSAAGTATATALVRTMETTTRTVRYVRFTPVKTKGDGLIQLADFSFFAPAAPGVQGDKITPINATAPDPARNADDANEGALKLIDMTGEAPNVQTKWLDTFSLYSARVVFEFAEDVEIGTYQLTTANDAEARDPIQWTLEGSLDGIDYFPIDSMNCIEFPMPSGRLAVSQEIPLPADGTFAPKVEFSITPPSILPGETIIMDWDVEFADTIVITPMPGTVGPTPVEEGGLEITGLSEETTFTLTATAESGRTCVQSIKIGGPIPFDGSFDFDGFTDNFSVLPVGAASITNPAQPVTPDIDRLRITSQANSQTGSAWYHEPVPIAAGFETTFEMQITHPGFINGADGLGFVVQSAGGNAAVYGEDLPLDPPTFGVIFDTYPNAGDPSSASAIIKVNGTNLQQVNLATGTTDFPAALAQGDNGNYLVSNHVYVVTVSYFPGKLDVYLDGTPIFENLNVDLAASGILDESGEAYIGFVARTGGLGENHDILAWSFTTDVDPPAAELAIVDSSFDFTGDGSLSLTFTSQSGMDYQITTSTDLQEWTPVGPVIPGEAGTTTTSIDLPESGQFFRVEEAVGVVPL